MPDNKHCQIHQVLEPSTKCSVPKEVAVKLLQKAYDVCVAKGYLTSANIDSESTPPVIVEAETDEPSVT